MQCYCYQETEILGDCIEKKKKRKKTGDKSIGITINAKPPCKRLQIIFGEIQGKELTIKEMLHFSTLFLTVPLSEKKYCEGPYWLSVKLFE